jgi:hypothetical protein
MHNSVLLCLSVTALCIALVIGQGLFPLFQAFQPPQQQQVSQLPPKQPIGSTPNEKLRACCAKVSPKFE